MFLSTEGERTVVYTSASDLTVASKCEFAFLRGLDAWLGRIDAVEPKPDPMLERTGRLGDEHELRKLEQYRTQFQVAEFERPDVRDSVALAEAAAQTREAFVSGADVVFQATFHDPGTPDPRGHIAFLGFADFIVRQPDGGYLVQDTKLARSARVTALLQLAAYAEQLERIGIPTADTVELLLGDGTVSEHQLRDIAPVYRNRRDRLHRIIRERLDAPTFVAWGDPRYTVCGHCDTCEAEIEASRDVLLVAGMRVTQRAKLAEAGIQTIDQLASSSGPIDGIGDTALAGLRAQARLQLEAIPESPPPYEVADASVLAAIPAPDPGDLFFDFEGDPLYTEGDATRWGIDYLFGMVDREGTFTAYWAHTFAEEKQALRSFLDDVARRRAANPGLHIYHYASYERTHLSSLAARHGIGEDEVDQLLREHVLVDLYPIVRKAVRAGSASYSIKKLEPLYMGTELRSGEVTNAADSITEYADAMALGASGDLAAQQHKLDEIADYNRYDCVSTLRLRDWLLGLASTHGIAPVDADGADAVELEPSPLHDALIALAGGPLDSSPFNADRTDDQTAAAFAAAALDYHRREHKTFWWGHFSRLVQPVEEWAETRDVLIVERAAVERDWFREDKHRVDRRYLRLQGVWAPGSSISAGGVSQPYILYDQPVPFESYGAEPGSRSARTVTVLEVGDDSILVQETLGKDVPHYSALPIAVTPASPPPAGQQKPAIEEWAQAIVDAAPDWPVDPAVDILRRTPPRTRSGSLAPAADEVVLPAVMESLLDLDSSYLAVQGPPGTGKTYLGAHVITELVTKHRWKIGVVAQSHAVVENLICGVVRAGLPARLVGKVTGDPDVDFTPLPKDGQLMFALENESTGYVVGGTAWDFSNPARIPRRSLDLLVVDEAGQFSLAATIASSVAARNLLLLGDPQQLPQVSQGLHPEPVDGSALGWITDGHDVLPPELGYFLPASRRMHPAVTAPVSELSYEGALHAHPDASARLLEGIEPGLHTVPVGHEGNSVESPEEADRVVSLVRQVLGLAWTDPSDGREPLTEAGIIVVSPYNAQVALVRQALDAAGHSGVRVGTVDKFQGQEAVIAIVTLAASSPVEVPRGMSFLLMRNRLNVAISRAKWAAYLVYSPELVEYLPTTPDGVAELSAFITLTERP